MALSLNAPKRLATIYSGVFTYRIHKQGPLYFGPLLFPPDKTRAFIELIPKMNDVVDSANGKFVFFTAFAKAPGMPKAHPQCLIFYDGPEEEAKKFVAPLFDLGPVMTMCAMTELAEITKPSDMTVGPPTHQHYFMSNSPLYPPLDLFAIEAAAADLDKMLTKFGASVAPSKIMLEVRSYTKSSSVHPSVTAFRGRTPGFLMAVECQYDGTNPADAIRAEVKSIVDKIKAAVSAKHQNEGKFFNANIGDGLEKISDMFGYNLPKLRQLKRKYDPNFVFNKWYPIPPAEAWSCP